MRWLSAASVLAGHLSPRQRAKLSHKFTYFDVLPDERVTSSNRSAPPPTETRETLRACGCGGQFVDVQLSGGFHQRVHAATHRGGGQLR